MPRSSKSVAKTSEKKVYQHNRLVEASHTLSLNEKRLVLYAASFIDSRKSMPKDGFIKIEAARFAETFNLELNNVYRAMKSAADMLYERDIRIDKPLGKKARIRWVYHIEYHEGEGALELGFSPSLEPYLTRLNREFTYYQLSQIGMLDSFYAIRLYELFAQYRSAPSKQFTVPLERLRAMLDMGTKYAAVKDLRRWVLTPSLKSINEHTDLTIKMETVKNGRNVTGFKFHIAQKEPSEGDREKLVGKEGVSDENA